MVDLVVGDQVIDYGLSALDTDCDEIHICSATPTDYADTLTKSLGVKTFTVGGAFSAPEAMSPGSGRVVYSVDITDGSVTADGTVTCWAAVDSANSRLLATGTLSGGGAVLDGQIWELESFGVRMKPIELPVRTFRGYHQFGPTGAGYGYQNFDIGDHSDDRLVVVAFSTQNTLNPGPVTLCGVNLNRDVYRLAGQQPIWIYSGLVPTGDGSQQLGIYSEYSDVFFCFVYTITGLSSSTVKNTAEGATSATISVDEDDQMIALNYYTGGAGFGPSTETPDASHPETDYGGVALSAEWTIDATNAAFDVHAVNFGMVAATYR